MTVGCSSHDDLHGSEVVSFDFGVGEPTVSLGCGDPAMAQEILDCHQFCIGIEYLGGHGMAKMMAGDPEAHLFGVGLHALLNPSNRQRLAPKGAFLIQEGLIGFGRGPDLEIVDQCFCGIITDIDDPIFCPFGLTDQQSLPSQVDVPKAEICHLTDPEPRAKHEHKDGSISGRLQGFKQKVHLMVSEVFGKGLRGSEAVAAFNGVGDGELLFLNQVVVELPDPLEMAVDGLGFEPPAHELVDILRDGPGAHPLNRSV